MKKQLASLIILGAMVVVSPVFAQLEADLGKAVDKQITENDFSGIVTVTKNGAKLYEKIAGYADEQTRVPITEKTRFSLGSIGKFFTGILIMNLIEEEKVNVDDPVNKYLPEWHIPNGDKIKVSHLLTHTSGLGGYMGTPEHNALRGGKANIDDLMKIIVSRPLQFDEPGSKHAYSNSGFIVLGKIIEKIESKSYYEVLQDRILIPLQMDKSTFDIDLANANEFAKGYAKDRSGNVTAMKDIIPPSADGGLFTTVGDMLKFDRGVFENKIISKKMLSEMETGRSSSYGYATMITRLSNGVGYGHNGGMPGYEAEYRHFFIGKDQYTVIILTNHDRKATQMMAVLETVLEEIH
ncbi:MAG TPA: serine hydrolase domain-containing protein [Cyclobacteriaceae bacterium]|nr:serine hydrolase domain-containing protein [Cyclobacteriaceae bacterium]